MSIASFSNTRLKFLKNFKILSSHADTFFFILFTTSILRLIDNAYILKTNFLYSHNYILGSHVKFIPKFFITFNWSIIGIEKILSYSVIFDISLIKLCNVPIFCFIDSIFLGLMTILVVILLFSLGDIQNIAAKFGEIANGNNWVWLIGAFGLCIAYFALWPLSQCIYGKALKVNASFTDSYLIGSSEHFYNGITPFAAGGQPFQIYSYTKRNTNHSPYTYY